MTVNAGKRNFDLKRVCFGLGTTSKHSYLIIIIIIESDGRQTSASQTCDYSYVVEFKPSGAARINK